jgi:hypothetical protein
MRSAPSAMTGRAPPPDAALPAQMRQKMARTLASSSRMLTGFDR